MFVSSRDAVGRKEMIRNPWDPNRALRSVALRPWQLSLVTSVLLLLLYNFSFWGTVIPLVTDGAWKNFGFLVSVFVFLLATMMLMLSLLSFKYVFKPVLIIVLVVASLARYFMDSYGVMIDTAMMKNVIQTDPGEITGLFNLKLLFHVVVFGFIPALIVFKARIHYPSLGRQSVVMVASVSLCLGAIGLSSLMYYKDYSSLLRNDGYVRYLMNPLNVVNAMRENVIFMVRKQHSELVEIGKDAVLRRDRRRHGKPIVTVLVVGETARAKDFALNGYARNTTPYLSKEDIFNFRQFYSCGTATAVSVPCMFSNFTKDAFDEVEAKHRENVLDVLTHAGVNVLWRDNNSGCKGVCNRVVTENMTDLHLPKVCTTNECYDEVLLDRLQDHLDKSGKDLFVVLHQKGSHGPDYYRRHPGEFAIFKPECVTNQLQDCTEQEIVNAYDNTIAYTDYFLYKVISFLKSNSSRFDSVMLYVSDHGESLGENNIFLHGIPYFIAPDEQTHVPFIVWLSPEYTASNAIDTACLKQYAENKLSHDNLFHSILGLMGVQTNDYSAALDVFSACKGKSPVMLSASASEIDAATPTAR